MLDRRALLGGALALPALQLAGCGGPADGPKSAKTASGLTKIRFATDWRAEAEHGGYYQALADGEFRKRGLDVVIIPGGPGSSVATLLATGAADLGVGSNSFGVLNLVAGKVPVKAVMAAMQKDPQVLMAHPGVGVRSIADMKGRPMLLGDEAVTSFWLWLKAKYGFTDAMVRKYTFNPGPFIANPMAIQEGYVSSEPYTVRKQGGFTPEVFLLADNGYPGYASMVLAPDTLIATNPAAIKAFVEAASVGWTRYLTGDARAGDALILKDNPDMRQDVLDNARAQFRAYEIFGPKGARIGEMTDGRWRTFFDMASGLGVYPKNLDYKSAYTLAFL